LLIGSMSVWPAAGCINLSLVQCMSNKGFDFGWFFFAESWSVTSVKSWKESLMLSALSLSLYQGKPKAYSGEIMCLWPCSWKW
jgi:hypothetical protein